MSVGTNFYTMGFKHPQYTQNRTAVFGVTRTKTAVLNIRYDIFRNYATETTFPFLTSFCNIIPYSKTYAAKIISALFVGVQ